MVDIRSLKSLVSKEFSKDSPLREVLLAERDSLETEEFLAKLEIWLTLLRIVTK